MDKFSLETKLEAVNAVLKQGKSMNSVAKSLHIARSTVRKWVLHYERTGVEGLSKKYERYSGQFKVQVIEYIRENKMSFPSAAAHFRIGSHTTISEWERVYWEEGPEALLKGYRGRKVSKDVIKKSKINKQMRSDLIAEVQRLRMENEYLKKLNALVQAREKSAKKTK